MIVGCANPEGEQGLQVGRLISARALGTGVPGMTINRYCASGLEAISLAVSKIKAGFGDIYVAGGAESMSMIPMTGYKLAPSYQANLENINYHVSMGATAEAVAEKYEITREQSDIFSYESHMKAAKAIDKGFFKEKIVPIDVETTYVDKDIKVKKNKIIEVDDGVRRDTSIEALEKLRAAFKKDGVVTAGNSSQTSDGVAFTLVVSEKIVKELNLKPMAKLLSVSVGGVDPIYMGIGPCVAIPKALKNANLNLNDIDQIELNEQKPVLVCVMDQKYLKNYYEILDLLRQNNINAEIFLDSKKNLGKQLTFANKRQLSVAIICGENEFKDNTVTIKNLKGVKGENNKTFSKKDLINEVKKLI